jgi:flagellar protein FliL
VAEENEKEVEEQEEEKKGSPLKFIIIGIIVVILGVGGFLAWMLFFSGGDEMPADEAAIANEAAVKENTMGNTFPMDTFVVNLNDPGGKRYLKTKIELEYFDELLGEELKQRLPQLRDVILLLLSSKSLDEIQGMEGKTALRRELIQRINQALKTAKVRNIYFTQFVIQ